MVGYYKREKRGGLSRKLKVSTLDIQIRRSRLSGSNSNVPSSVCRGYWANVLIFGYAFSKQKRGIKCKELSHSNFFFPLKIIIFPRLANKTSNNSFWPLLQIQFTSEWKKISKEGKLFLRKIFIPVKERIFCQCVKTVEQREEI